MLYYYALHNKSKVQKHLEIQPLKQELKQRVTADPKANLMLFKNVQHLNERYDLTYSSIYQMFEMLIREQGGRYDFS